MRRSAVRRWTGLLVVCGALSAAWWLRDELTLRSLAVHEATLRHWQSEWPVLSGLTASLVYIVVTAVSLPGATVLSLLLAWLFGFWLGLLLVSVSSTIGAIAAFLLSRYLLRDYVYRRFAERLPAAFQPGVTPGREAPQLAWYLLTLRLIPAAPFFVINVVMGLTNMRVRTFWYVSQLGMLPGTAVFVYAGSQVPSLQVLADQGLGALWTTRLLGAFALLAILPLLLQHLVRPRRKPRQTAERS